MFLNLFHVFWEMQNKKEIILRLIKLQMIALLCFLLQHHTKPEPQRSKHNNKKKNH